MQEDKLSTVHDAVNQASIDLTPENPAMVVATFKIHQDDKDSAQDICVRNGTTLSSYLRQCCKKLISDYKK